MISMVFKTKRMECAQNQCIASSLVIISKAITIK